MHKIGDTKWVIGKSDTVFFHPSGGLSSTDGLRRIGDVDPVGVKISASLFAGITAKDPWPRLEWSGNTLTHRGEWLPAPVARTPLQDEWAGDWVDVAIPSGWKPIVGAVAKHRAPEFRHVWASIASDKMVFAVATDAFIMAWGGTFDGWADHRNIPIRPDVFKRSSGIRLKPQETDSPCYIAVMGRRRELVFFEEMTELPIAGLIETATQLASEQTANALAPPEVLDDACAVAKAQLQSWRPGQQGTTPMMDLSTDSASIETDSGSWASPITGGPADPMAIQPHLLRAAVEMSSTSEFRYRPPFRCSPTTVNPKFVYLLFTGDESSVLTMAYRAD